MRAISPGRPQSTRQALCTAHWDDLRLVAYISGNTVVILDGPRHIVQTISVDNVRSLLAVTIEESSGRIAVCDEHLVQIYNAIGRDEDDLRWAHTEEIDLGGTDNISCLSWSSSDEILVGGSQLWLYHLPLSGVSRLLWQQKVANPVHLAAFSNDSELIATCGQHDRIVKIWRRLSFELDNTRFDVSYLPHPAAVTSIHWRKPWHVEQSLDNLLYTFCSDDHVRLWTYSDPHSLSVMQLIATIDTTTSIQPRRLSVGSLSRKRFVFILDSRDFSQATEKSLQQARSRVVDHALEHLVEVANRSPEICVVFDGMGHMSAWGLENAGCRSRKPAVVFNVTLVDDVRIALNFETDKQTDCVQFCAFAGGTSPASLSLLVHTYTGQVDWYESPIAQFFDTSTQEQRLHLISSWSGHNLAVDHIARSVGGGEILSWTDEGQAILWSQTFTGALQRKCQIDAIDGVIAVVLLSLQGFLISLHEDQLILWSLLSHNASQIYTAKLHSKRKPRNLRPIVQRSAAGEGAVFAVEFEDSSFTVWSVRLPSLPQTSAKVNGFGNPLEKLVSITSADITRSTRGIAVDEPNLTQVPTEEDPTSLITVDDDGLVKEFSMKDVLTNGTISLMTTLETGIGKPLLGRAIAEGLLALTDEEGKQLFIFNTAQGSREWSHEFGGPDHIQKMAWTTSRTGSAMLFVSFSYHAHVIGQQRYTIDEGKQCWSILQDISLRDFTTSYIGDVSWLPSNNLAIGAGNQIFVMEAQCNQLGMQIDASNRLAHGQEVANIVTQLNSALPIFHPTYLRFIAQDGDYQQVFDILIKLYEKLKYLAEGDELDSFLDQGTAYWSTSYAGHDKYQVSGQDTHTISDVKASLQEYIRKSTIHQLSEEERSELADFVSIISRIESQLKSIDENGLRYLLALYATKIDQEMPWRSFVFASRSSSQEVLVDLIVRYHDNKLTWNVARRTGLFVWLIDETSLQTQFENVARAEYTKHEDRNPVNCSLYYLALNKKNVLQGLWRMTIGVKEKENTMKLLANNFDDVRWQSTAMKNAYALLSKRRFGYAAAFFLLGSSLKDAVNVCINQLDDLQLAIAITRVWTKDENQSQSVLRELLVNTVVPQASKNEQGRWMAVWGYSQLGQLGASLCAITRPLHTATNETTGKWHIPAMSYKADDPHLLLVYQQIRTDLLRKGQWSGNVVEAGEEKAYLLRVAAWLTRAGLDVCATQITSNWEFVEYQTLMVTSPDSSGKPVTVKSTRKRDETPKSNLEKPSKPLKPPPTQFVEPSADSLLDSFGF